MFLLFTNPQRTNGRNRALSMFSLLTKPRGTNGYNALFVSHPTPPPAYLFFFGAGLLLIPELSLPHDGVRAIPGPSCPHNPQNDRRGGPGDAPWAGDGATTMCDDGGGTARITVVMSSWCCGCATKNVPLLIKGVTLR